VSGTTTDKIDLRRAAELVALNEFTAAEWVRIIGAFDLIRADLDQQTLAVTNSVRGLDMSAVEFSALLLEHAEASNG